MLIIPAVDIRAGQTVRLQQGDPERTLIYGDDPVASARRWVDLGARWLHVVDLDGAFTGRPVHLGLLARICALGVPVQAGGGFRTREDIARGLDAGAARIVVGTAAIALGDELGWWGEQVAVSLDVRDGRIAVRGWTGRLAVDAATMAADLRGNGVTRFIYTDVARDGMLAGPDVEMLRTFVEVVGVPVIAAGGVRSADDLAPLARTGVEGVIIGRALYEGRIDLSAVLAAWSLPAC